MKLRSANSPSPRPRRGGFTLIELLVSVGILVIMLLAFGQIVSQSQTLVNGCQQLMRMNAAASVVAQLLQRDLISVSKDGSLTIGTGKLTFTRVAPHISVLDPTIYANAALVDYGRKAYDANGILYRQAILLTGTGGTTAADAQATNLGPSLTAPAPALPADINAPMGVSATQYWSYLTGGCTQMDVSFWNGSAWANSGSFTSANLTNWPTTVKAVFTLKDGETSQKYEFLLDLP